MLINDGVEEKLWSAKSERQMNLTLSPDKSYKSEMGKFHVI